MTSKIKIWCHKLVHFGRFEGSFLTILRIKKVVSFGKCLGFVFPIKMPTFILFATRNWVSPLGSPEDQINVDKASTRLLVLNLRIQVRGCSETTLAKNSGIMSTRFSALAKIIFWVNKVEHQKLNQTTAELSFSWFFGIQIGLRQIHILISSNSQTIFSKRYAKICQLRGYPKTTYRQECRN